MKHDTTPKPRLPCTIQLLAAVAVVALVAWLWLMELERNSLIVTNASGREIERVELWVNGRPHEGGPISPGEELELDFQTTQDGEYAVTVHFSDGARPLETTFGYVTGGGGNRAWIEVRDRIVVRGHELFRPRWPWSRPIGP